MKRDELSTDEETLLKQIAGVCESIEQLVKNVTLEARMSNRQFSEEVEAYNALSPEEKAAKSRPEKPAYLYDCLGENAKWVDHLGHLCYYVPTMIRTTIQGNLEEKVAMGDRLMPMRKAFDHVALTRDLTNRLRTEDLPGEFGMDNKTLCLFSLRAGMTGLTKAMAKVELESPRISEIRDDLLPRLNTEIDTLEALGKQWLRDHASPLPAKTGHSL